MLHPRRDPGRRRALANHEPARSQIVSLRERRRTASKLVKVSVRSADGALLNTFEVTTIEEARELIAVLECPKLSVGDTISLAEIDE